MKQVQGPKVLILDIETAPLEADVWGLWENNVALNQVLKDWQLLSWSAKWLEPGPYAKDERSVFYADRRGGKGEKSILKPFAKLIFEADVVLTQNGKHFDIPSFQAKCLEFGIKGKFTGKHIDTKQLAQRNFRFPSYRLEYMTEKFNVKYKKLKHKEFPGHEMWTEVRKDNVRAWRCMEKYNKYDVLALEELYHHFAPYDNTVNWSVYNDLGVNRCSCGSTHIKENGHDYSGKKGKYKRYKCVDCGKPYKSTKNLLDKATRDKLLVPL